MESRNFQEQIESMAQGVAIKNMASVKILKEIQVPTPALSEQKRIVAILDQSFADIDKARVLTEQNLKNARELFDSYLQQVFSQRGDGWVVSKLSDVARVIDSLHKTPKYSDQGYPMVRVTDVRQGPLDLSETKRVSKEVYEEFSKNHKAKVGDIVFSRVGSYGRSSIVTSKEPFCLGQNTVFLSPSFNGQYFYYFLNSRYAQQQIDRLVAGTTQPTVSLKSIKAIEVPIPPETEQLGIVKKLDEMFTETSNLERIYEAKIAATELLKKSLLQKAFSGELTKDKQEAA
jgi:type I restriction enzyme S subunit